MQTPPLTTWQRFAHYAAIRVQGAEAHVFLQSQLTQDVASLKPDNALLAAYLSVKGRVLAVIVLLQESPESLLMIVPASIAEPLRTRMARFVMRAKASLSPITELSVEARILDGSEAEPTLRRLTDELGYSIGERQVRLVDHSLADHDASADFAAAWQLHGIRAEFPEIEPSTQDLFVPQALSLERWGALNFQKGCYPGQEIVARLHYLGAHKRCLRRLVSSEQAQLLPGTGLYSATASETETVAEVVQCAIHSAGTDLLVVVKKSAQFPLAPVAQTAHAELPSGVRFALPSESA